MAYNPRTPPQRWRFRLLLSRVRHLKAKRNQPQKDITACTGNPPAHPVFPFSGCETCSAALDSQSIMTGLHRISVLRRESSSNRECMRGHRGLLLTIRTAFFSLMSLATLGAPFWIGFVVWLLDHLSCSCRFEFRLGLWPRRLYCDLLGDWEGISA